jgi:hypothetical protein
MEVTNNIRLTVEDWAIIVIKEWLKMARALNMKLEDPNTTERFRYFLTPQANGDIERITFTFDYYLKFVNWGVGKGVDIRNRDTLALAGLTKRRKKPWYDDVFPKQLFILSHLLAERYSQRAIALIKTGLGSYDSSGNLIKSASKPGKSSSSSSGKITYKQFQANRKKQGW